MGQKTYVVDHIFNGEDFKENVAISVNNGSITAVFSAQKLPKNTAVTALKGALVAPAFIDLQINGAGGLMFSSDPSIKALSEIYHYSQAGGATHFLATIPTNSLALIQQAVQAVHAYWAAGLPGLSGLHLEGPFINPIKKGAHLEKFIKRPTLKDAQELIEIVKGTVKMITLAPECCSDKVIRYLLNQNILLSAGHSNASYKEALHGFSLGIDMCTHLYNAMSPLTHKDAGLVGAALDRRVYAGIIADGVHVNSTAFNLATQILEDRLFYVTDAVTEVHSQTYQYHLTGNHYVTPQGTLAGSCLKMDTAVANAIEMGTQKRAALRSASFIPAKILKMDHILGKIAPGYGVDWVILDHQYKAVGTVVE